MKTKLLMTLLFIALSMSFSWAQKSLSLTSAKAGDLFAQKFDPKFVDELKGTTHLKVSGVVDATDFSVFSFHLRNTLEEIDLSAVTSIKEYNGNQGTLLGQGDIFYNAEEIPTAAFQAFRSLKKVLLPKNLESIGSSAFHSCEKLTELEIPKTLKFMSGNNTFNEAALTSLELPEGVEFKHKYVKEDEYTREMFRTFAFPTIKPLHFKVPANVTKIRSAFPYPSVSITFDKNSKLEHFEGFTSDVMTELVFPEGVKIISGIGGMTNLKHLEFPSTAEEAKELAGMPKLQSIVSHAMFPPNLIGKRGRVSFSDIEDKSKITLYVPAAAVENYKAESGWKDFNIKIIGSDSESQTINNFSDIAAVLGEEITLSAKASSNLPVTYSIADATVASLSGNVVKVLKEGETTITAKQAGDGINFQAVEKTIQLTVLNLTWLEAPTIIYSGSSAKVVGPKDLILKFTKFFVNDAESPIKDGSVDLADKAGELNLKATTADGSEIIKLKINKQ